MTAIIGASASAFKPDGDHATAARTDGSQLHDFGSIFLKPDEVPVSDVTGTSDDHPFPMRGGCRVTPLIEAADMYPDLERLVLGAERTVYFAFRIFDPSTKARSPEALAQGLTDWTAIIRHAVERGVVVRLLLTDFEPIVAHDLHSLSWGTYRTLRDMAEQLPKDRLDGFEMVIIQHVGEIGWGIRQLLRLPIRWAIGKVLRELGESGEDLEQLIAVRPGLWRHHRLTDGRLRYRAGPPPRMWPSTYHQKFAVVDDKIAILGGLDVNERRWDDKRHRQRADQTWHDISCRLEGPAVADCAEHFRRLWNMEMPRYREIAAEWMTGVERELVLDPLDPIEQAPAQPAPLPDGKARVQVLRTISRRDPNPFAVGPKPHIQELKAAHRKLIFSAERLLYIESQFFRYQRAARWIVERARQAPSLQVIIVLPNAPEEVAFERNKHAAHRHGEWLQARAIDYIRLRLRDRVGFFSLAKPAPASESEKEFAPDRGTAFGSGLIHVHSKVLIADDVTCLISSANINGRSFKWDTEFGMLWQDPEAVRSFRSRLWQQLLDLPGASEWSLEEALARWREIAARNIAVEAEERQGFVIPHQVGRTRRFGRPAWFVPDDLV